MSKETGCRNKARMVLLLGAAHQPVLGADVKSGDNLEMVSLTHCPLYTEDMTVLLDYLQDWIRTSGIPPYNKAKRKGELKYILLTRSAHFGEVMLRFVM